MIGAGVSQDDPYAPDFVLDFFCLELAHHPCNYPDRPLCASDGRTYSNLCQFQKARCVFREIDFVEFGACSSGANTSP
ncbi:tomoregulin-2-like isoform X4 [Babylonia areolata]